MSVAQNAVLTMIQWYRNRISANTLPRCKYYPTCSTYALTAVERYGAFRGILLSVLRLMRCRPWSRGGIDDVPEKFSVFYRFSWSSAHEEPSIEPKYHPYDDHITES